MQDKKQTIKILEALANGVDPVTGKKLPAESVYHSPDVLRALFNAITLLNNGKAPKKYLKILDNESKYWTDEEEDLLKQRFEEGKKVDELANLHGRSKGAIRSRLNKLGLV